MRKINEQWIEDGRMYKAVAGDCNTCDLKIKNDCHLGHWCDMQCIKDLGPVNEDGCLAEERTGLFPVVSRILGTWIVGYFDKTYSISCSGLTRQEAIDAWNQREATNEF